jgi:tungstate transport system substrate-binding protein
MKRGGFFLLALVLTHNVWSQSIILASTTSTEQSGLFVHLLPLFKQAKAIDVRVVALGTGQALDMGRRGDADVLLVHDTAAEEKFVADGWGIKRYPVMYNDFVLVGSQADPAKVRGKDILKAFRQLAASDHEFISRGDKSGTHTAELRLWKLLEQELVAIKGYKACGCGMGPALNMAAAKSAYVLTDRGTWLSFKNKGDLVVLVDGDAKLFNPYGVIVINPAVHPHVKSALAQQLADWLVSLDGQKAIATYTIGGEPLFFSNTPVNKAPSK